VERLALEHPDVRKLLVAESHGRAEERLAVRALIAQLDQLADDRVQIGHLLERGRGGAVGRVLDRARRDLVELVGAVGKAHPPSLSGGRTFVQEKG
jgi:hypothetical protein